MKIQSTAAKPHPRIALTQPATVEDGDGRTYPCTVIDVSQEGFRLKIAQVLAPGSGYVLHLGDEAHRIEIRWATPGEAGGLFLEKIA